MHPSLMVMKVIEITLCWVSVLKSASTSTVYSGFTCMGCNGALYHI